MNFVKRSSWLLGLGLAAAVAAPAMADHLPIPQPAPAPLVTANNDSNNSGTSSNVYDMAPACGRAAYYDEQYQRTYAELQMVIERLRKEYLLSDEYRTASKKLDDAKAAYDAARAPVLQAVTATQECRDLLEKRTRVSIALQQPKLPKEDVAALAQRKMEYGATASRMEAEALNADVTVRQTRADYLAAQAELNDKLAHSQLALVDQPAYVTAKKAFDLASDNRAAAQGVLAGAWISRNDTVDSDYRRYPPPSGNLVAPWIGVGYPGYWTGYYGNVGAIRPF